MFILLTAGLGIPAYEAKENNGSQTIYDQSAPDDCTCVKYYLCNDTMTINKLESGGVIDIA